VGESILNGITCTFTSIIGRSELALAGVGCMSVYVAVDNTSESLYAKSLAEADHPFKHDNDHKVYTD
jgi:hypothetical protein